MPKLQAARDQAASRHGTMTAGPSPDHGAAPQLPLEALNQVERWFRLLTDRQLRRGAHDSIAALERDIESWIEHWNADPKPFVWTKTADEILDRLARYLQRIPGAGHEWEMCESPQPSAGLALEQLSEPGTNGWRIEHRVVYILGRR